MKMRTQYKICGTQGKQYKREIHSVIGLSQEARKSSKNITLHLKNLKKKNHQRQKWIEKKK